MYIYHHIAHMAKLCLGGGCGIRPVLDLWIIRKSHDYMSDELRRWLKKSGYFLSRIFVSHDEIIEQYPIVEKHKFLMPFCQFHRLFSFIFGKKRNVMKSEVQKVNTF